MIVGMIFMWLSGFILGVVVSAWIKEKEGETWMIGELFNLY